MKKNTLKFITLILFIAGFFSACKEKPEALCACGKIEINKKEYIAMCVVPEVVTSNSVNYLRMENFSKQIMLYGYSFFIEYFYENHWELIKTDIIIELPLLYLEASTATEEEMNLYSFAEKYNSSKKGKYRIVKDVSLSTGQYNSYDLVAEFEFK